jgi:hypothetical protein
MGRASYRSFIRYPGSAISQSRNETNVGVLLEKHLTGNSLEQFTTGAQPVILWPAKYKSR